MVLAGVLQPVNPTTSRDLLRAAGPGVRESCPVLCGGLCGGGSPRLPGTHTGASLSFESPAGRRAAAAASLNLGTLLKLLLGAVWDGPSRVAAVPRLPASRAAR